MRVLVAARLSRLADGQTGLDTQDAGVRQWAEANGHRIIFVVADRKSGTSHPWERKNLKPWVTEPHLIAQYDAIAAFKIDRLSRGDDASTSKIEKWALDNGKQLLTADGLYYPCEGVDSIRWDAMKRLAHQEWLGYSEKYRRMQKHLRENGFLIGGRAPYGFRIVTVEGTEHKTLEPDPVEKDIILKAIERYLAGDTLLQVCRWLDAEGNKPHNSDSWAPRTLQKIFRSALLIGRREDRNGKTSLKVAPILDMQTWQKLQSRMDEKAYRKGIPSKNEAMLAGIVLCAKCGGPIYHVRTGNKLKDGTPYRKAYYRCHGKARNPSKCKNMIPLEMLEEYVDQWFTDPCVFGAHEIVETQIIPGYNHENEIAEVERDIRELDMDDPAYLDKVATLRAKRAELKALPSEPDRITECPSGITVAEYWRSLDDRGKRDYMIKAEIQVHASRDEQWMTGHPDKIIGTLTRCAMRLIT